MQIYSCKSLIEPLTGTDTVSLPFSLYQTGSQSWWPVGRLFFSSLCLSFYHCGHFSMANTEDEEIRVLCLLCVGQCSVRQIGKMQWRCCWVIILLWLCYIYKTTVEKMCWERKRKREREREERKCTLWMKERPYSSSAAAAGVSRRTVLFYFFVSLLFLFFFLMFLWAIKHTQTSHHIECWFKWSGEDKVEEKIEVEVCCWLWPAPFSSSSFSSSFHHHQTLMVMMKWWCSTAGSICHSCYW